MELISTLFFWTGLTVWGLLSALVIYFILRAVGSVWCRTVYPALCNLRFAFFGKPKNDPRSYYEYWKDFSNRLLYRYYIHGAGSRCFARCAMRRLLYEARKESLLIGYARRT